MITQSRNYGQLRVVMLNGVTIGGFNVVDIVELHCRTQLPIIVITRQFPDMDSIRRALENLPQPKLRFESILKAGEINEVLTKWRGGPVYYQCKGMEKEDAARLIVDTAVHSRLPKPVRVAHLIATGVVLGESRRRASGEPVIVLSGTISGSCRSRTGRAAAAPAAPAARWTGVPVRRSCR